MSNSSSVEATWLCGSAQPEFWDPVLLWSTDLPGLTKCFRKSLWTFPAFLMFWVFIPFEAQKLFRSKARDVPFTWLNLSRVLTAGVLAVVAIIDLCYWALDDQVAPIDVIDPVLRIILFVGIIVLVNAERARGIRVSSFQCIFWCVFSITSLLCGYAVIRDLAVEDPNQGALEIRAYLPPSTFFISCFCIFLSFGLHFFVDAPPEYLGPHPEALSDKPCPSHSSSFPSTVTFSWFTTLAWQGFKRALTADDLWDLPRQITCKTVVTRFNRYWDVALAAADLSGKTGGRAASVDTDAAFKKTKDEVQVVSGKKSGDKPPKGSLSLMPSLTKAFGASFVSGAVFKLAHDILVFAPPLLLKKIISFSSGDDPIWQGIFYACILLAAATLQTLLLSTYFYKMYMISLWLRSSLTSALYTKCLRVAQSAKKEFTTGEVVNLMSVDVQRLVDVMPYLNSIWSSPLQIIVCLFFLWQQLGPSVLAGLATMILMLPLQGAIMAKSRTFQIAQMKEKDQRVKMMNEILQGMKILKLYAWEPSFEKVVQDIRNKEIAILRKQGYLQAGSWFVWTCAPFLVSLVTFATYVLSSSDNVLDSKKAFVSLALFNILRFPMVMLPMMVTGLVQAIVSVKRINKYMNCEELPVAERDGPRDDTQNKNQDSEKVVIHMEKASFTWEADAESPTLSNISLDVKKGSLVGIVGSVGSGKSSLASSLLGELERLSGDVWVHGRIAYVAQQAWIQNATLKDNILFGQSFDQDKYNKVIQACALESDLKMLPAGDSTEIGEKGINLSGGQKQRVSLARACYSESDIYVLDDPLSAVDAHVGKHIFEQVISGTSGLLKDKTRVLITHGITYLPHMDNVVVLKDGEVSEMGTYDELLEKKGEFAEFLVQYLTEDDDGEEASELKHLLEETMGKEELQTKLLNRVNSISSDPEESATAPRSRKSSESPVKAFNRQKSVMSNGSTGSALAANTKAKEKPVTPAAAKQYQEEKSETGTVNFRVFLYYIVNMGAIMFTSCIIFYILYEVCSVASSIWLARWSDSNTEGLMNATKMHGNYTEDAGERNLYLGVFGSLGIGQGIASMAGSIFLYISTLRGSQGGFFCDIKPNIPIKLCISLQRLHHHMLSNVLQSPMSFFDTTPQGRILNRFSKDVDVLDNMMPMILRGWITCLLAVISTFSVIAYTTPIFLVPMSVILLGYYIVQRIYVATSRELKRLESISRSPIYSHFGETVNGVQTIRAYNLQKQFILESEKKVDLNQKAAFPGVVANRWLAVRLETVGNIIIFCAALFAVLGRDSLSPGLVGLSVTYAMSVTQILNWVVRMTSEFETNIVAAERMKEYSETPTEAAWRDEDKKPSKEWPEKGKISFKNYSTRYRAGLDLVLDDLSFDVSGGERVGIVGRTGAGKSSLTLALFRMVEAANGKIIIDDVDIANVGLHDLREKLTIIPQDPVLFSGSLRLNLDPFDHFSDEEVWRALEHAHLKSFVETSLSDGLSHTVAEGGENLSVGQRQLLCLARALLRKTKVLILDEATAAVDMETDDLIQQTIKEEFSDATVLTIAHRLNTIIDYNKILVLDKGKVAEFGEPKTLLADKKSSFYGMCKEANLVS